MNRLTAGLGRALAHYLEKQTGRYAQFAVTPQEMLRRCLRPGDVLLIEGDRRISAAIKYLTVSTWSHAALYVGDKDGCDLIEADLRHGVRYASLEDYGHLNSRICRPVGLAPDDILNLTGFMRVSIGKTYDLKNVIDLARYLLPQPPVPKRWRRRMLALGSGDPTRAICSTLIAEAFQRIGYPVLPEHYPDPDDPARRELLHIRHHSLYAPRDFDLSPYFAVVKPTIEQGFDYRSLSWDSPSAALSPPSDQASPRP
ncbi:MAG TPA: YiiX/YebB-like N1pC/P60 family cysteine hydrolase [Albidovulum sp.]|uniref:lipo-like protein n=1 Tax=Albidovulum sp. TaxID=1872424 RepID=UPI002C391898|nr:YiiX/YebB-like N1pC/P60 family cysteine hydrolase [Albidovulum sp.]